MNAILRQAKANLRAHGLQAALVFFTLFAAATLLTVALSTLHTAQGAFDRLFERTNAAHLWLLLDPVAMPPGEIETILAEIPGVEATGRAYRTVSTTLFLGGVRESGPALRNWPDEDDSVAHPLLVEGRAPQPGESDAIVLDRNAAVEYNVDVGDTIGVLTPSGRQDLKVIGRFVSTEVCPTCFPFINYVAPGTMAELGLLPSADTDVGALDIALRLEDPSQTQAILQAVQKALPADAVWGWDHWQDLRSYADSSVQLQRVLLLTFTGVAGLAAGFLIANTTNGAVRAQTRQMGLLKAVGFTGGQLALVFLVEYLGLALVASLAGVLLGSWISTLTLRSVTLLFGETLVCPAPWVVLVTPLGTLLLSAAFALLAVRRAVRLNAVDAIRFGEQPPRYRGGGPYVGVLRRLPLSLGVGLREIFSQPLRAALTAVGLCMAVVTIVSALTLQATFWAILSDPAQLGFDGDLFLRRSKYISEGDVRQLIGAQPEVSAYYVERWRSFQFPGENNYYHARFREGDIEAFRFPIVEGRMFQKHGEAVVGYGLVNRRGIRVGDRIDILIADQPFSLQVVGTYRENSNNGRMLLLPMETLSRALLDFEVNTFVVKLHSQADAQGVAQVLTDASNDLLGVRVTGEQELPRSLTSLPKIMAALTLILGGIAALGVLNSVWMTVQERRREFGVLKSVGMTPEQVIASVLAAVAGIAVLAYVVGLPLGLIGIRALMSTVATNIGFGPIDHWTDEVGLALLLPGVVLLALIGAFIPAYRAGRTSVIDVLHYE
jgi:putative ABC transport system permease protein